MDRGFVETKETIAVFVSIDDDIRNRYELLSVLDGKAAALLTFNAIALASISIWLGYVPLNYLHLALDLVFVALLVSCVFLLRVIHLRWVEWEDFPEVADLLDAIRDKRSGYYGLARRLSLVAVGALVAISVVHTLGTILIATNSCSLACEVFYSENVFGNLDYGP